jgi:hypothetical protein
MSPNISSTSFAEGKVLVLTEGIFMRETEKAVLIGYPIIGSIWLPLSQMPKFPEIFDVQSGECEAIIPRWLAEKNGIEYTEIDPIEMEEKDWDDRDAYAEMMSTNGEGE